ncbi:MAG: hypothetical protein A2694_02960 [Candidatus Blackburnbacteria bacterium RIFCSPHIGHO2_01_FULL_40_17]|nr:MAG: hypothetical protein A2694_02960 [Candidatus Blackburnbacteria bacterium RIFCSPHIGHO2_01_FULL_40_17]OGY15119.1 MAG: hypothetical protein A3I52_00005 [Candidatus Blackburnbacteria bacterium RIFCSPLOWO2_02_FULL_40_10]
MLVNVFKKRDEAECIECYSRDLMVLKGVEINGEKDNGLFFRCKSCGKISPPFVHELVFAYIQY